MKANKYILAVLLCLSIALPSMGQEGYIDVKSIEKVRMSRYKKIDFYHLGIGLESSANTNVSFAPKFFAGIGSHRNWVNIDVGLKYQFVNPLFFSTPKKVSLQNFVPFAATNVNLLRWNMNSLSVGGEIAYHLITNANCESSLPYTNDRTLGKNHVSVRGNIGLNFNRCNITAFCEYDLAPAMNQKYVFESTYYDYQKLYDSLFERVKYGLSFSYYFRY